MNHFFFINYPKQQFAFLLFKSIRVGAPDPIDRMHVGMT